MKAIKREEAVRLCLEGERISPAERNGWPQKGCGNWSLMPESTRHIIKRRTGKWGKISGFRTFRR